MSYIWFGAHKAHVIRVWQERSPHDRRGGKIPITFCGTGAGVEVYAVSDKPQADLCARCAKASAKSAG